MEGGANGDDEIIQQPRPNTVRPRKTSVSSECERGHGHRGAYDWTKSSRVALRHIGARGSHCAQHERVRTPSPSPSPSPPQGRVRAPSCCRSLKLPSHTRRQTIVRELMMSHRRPRGQRRASARGDSRAPVPCTRGRLQPRSARPPAHRRRRLATGRQGAGGTGWRRQGALRRRRFPSRRGVPWSRAREPQPLPLPLPLSARRREARVRAGGAKAARGARGRQPARRRSGGHQRRLRGVLLPV